MKASRFHYFFAEEWPIYIWVAITVAVSIFFVSRECWHWLVSPSNWFDPLLFVGCVLLAVLLGFYGGILPGFFVLFPLYAIRRHLNGEPYRKGDMVQILVGPYRDRVVCVAEAFDIGAYSGAHRIRIELADEEVKPEHYFQSHQILLVARVQP